MVFDYIVKSYVSQSSYSLICKFKYKITPPNFFNDYYIILTEAKKVNNTALITGS